MHQVMMPAPARDCNCSPCSGCIDNQAEKMSSLSSTTMPLDPPIIEGCECCDSAEGICGDRECQQQRQDEECSRRMMRPLHQQAFIHEASHVRLRNQSRPISWTALDKRKRQPLNTKQPTIAMRQQHHATLRSTTYSFHLLLLCMAIGLLITIPVSSEDTTDEAASDEPPSKESEKGSGVGTPDNPQNKFCGITHAEAHQFCHLEPHKSLPCPLGEEDCPYNMPCWEIEERCTAPPTSEPTGRPTPFPVTGSPITARSADAGDHHFCGLGFDNLFGCAINCPNGSPAECPSGQLCYFNTPCDARIEGRQINDPTQKPIPEPTYTPTISFAPQRPASYGLGRHNFCGTSYADASEYCSFDTHCPGGSNNECEPNYYCYVEVKDCDVFEFPTMKPTVSPKPTEIPTPAPSTPNPANTWSPTFSPLEKDDIRNFFYCGVDWGDASSRCYKRCLSGHHNECADGEKCFAQAGCKGVKNEQPPPSKSDETKDPSFSIVPTPIPLESDEPTMSPLPADDYRNFFFCGTSWMDATKRCYKKCLTGRHDECPGVDECFAQADCKEGVIVPKTERPTGSPTPAPLDGTRSPTISPVPTNEPTTAQPTISPTNPVPTRSPLKGPTFSPSNGPSDRPTTPYPTHHPTYAPCAGEPCGDKEHCRSNQNFCGSGPYYCNEKSIWVASCGVPTDPPVSVAPTTISPSMVPSTTSSPTLSSPPTGKPTKLSEMIYFMTTYSPTGEKTKRPTVAKKQELVLTASPTINVDDQYFAPEDPLGSFFCGKDWIHAIEKCPHRCPSGEAYQCPKGWQCYAFTPCLGIGINAEPTAKPTWEPTRRPTPEPTPVPTTAKSLWAQKNEEKYGHLPLITDKPTQPTPKPVWWTPPPTRRPTYMPTDDQCEGDICDYEGECRSRLGFCGMGIIYCNAASTWVPKCGGSKNLIRREPTPNPTSVSPNTEPTAAPLNSWEVWVDNNPTNTSPSPVEQTYTFESMGKNSASEDNAVEETTEDIEADTSAAYAVDQSSQEQADKDGGDNNEEDSKGGNNDDNISSGEDNDDDISNKESIALAPDGYAGYRPESFANWGNQARSQNEMENREEGDLRWWIVPNSTRESKHFSLLVKVVSRLLFFMTFISVC